MSLCVINGLLVQMLEDVRNYRRIFKSCEINSWLGHQGCELRDKVQGLEDDVCGAIAIRGFEFIPNLSVGG